MLNRGRLANAMKRNAKAISVFTKAIKMLEKTSDDLFAIRVDAIDKASDYNKIASEANAQMKVVKDQIDKIKAVIE
jgi:hypothetical protein